METSARAEGEGEAERYAGAFARVRLVRAWIAAVAAMVAMVYAYVALLERVQRWWSSIPFRRAPRRAAVLAAWSLLGVLGPTPLFAHGTGARDAGRLADRETPSRFISVTITHGGSGAASVFTNSSGSTSFTVANSGSAGTVLLSATDCTGSISNCSASPAAGYLATGWSMPVTVSFTGGMTPGSGSFTLRVRDQSDNSLLATYAVNVTVSADPNAPTLGLAPHVGDRRDVSQCVADCFESTLAYTTPAYVSLDVPRSVTLLYRSGRAFPHGTLTLDVSDPQATATSFRLKLRDSTGAYVTFSNNTQELYFARNTSGATRIVAQFAAASIPTSAQLYTAEVTANRPAGVQSTALAAVRIIVLNDARECVRCGRRRGRVAADLHQPIGRRARHRRHRLGQLLLRHLLAIGSLHLHVACR